MTDSFEILKKLAEDDRYNWLIVDFILGANNLKEFIRFMYSYPRQVNVVMKYAEPKELAFTVEGVTFDSFNYPEEPPGTAISVNFFGYLIIEGHPSRSDHILFFTLRPGSDIFYKVTATCHEITLEYFIDLLREIYQKWPETNLEILSFLKRISLIHLYPGDSDKPEPQPVLPESTRMRKSPKYDAINRVAMALFSAKMKEVPTESAGAQKYGTSIQTVNKLRDHPRVQSRLEYLLAHPEYAVKLRQQIAQERSASRHKKKLV